jgi:phosphatidylethanolamine/phosphatidyl-N-methylethanolamine N-methyltransferase
MQDKKIDKPRMTDSRVSIFAYMREFMRYPRNVGSFAESGLALSKAMAQAANASDNGIFVEFGPGTGVITMQLLAHGVSPTQFMLVEFNPIFAAKLRKRFPLVKVIEGDAWQIETLMAQHFPDQKCAAIVSSLPLLNFPEKQRSVLMKAVAAALDPRHGRFVQFSYGLKKPVEPEDGFSVSRTGWILKNLPPARVWVYSRRMA